MFLIKVNVFYLLLWYLIRSSMANDICESFAKNNFSIDYGFGGRDMRSIDPMLPQKGWLVIEDKIWRFEVNKNNGSIDLATNGNAIPLGLTKETKMAFIGIDGNLGLIDKNGSIHMTSFADSNETKDKYNFKEIINFNWTGNLRYIPFTFRILDNSIIIGFMAQNYNSRTNQFKRDVTFYHIYEYHIFEQKFYLDSLKIIKTIYNFDKSIEILAIYGPYVIEKGSADKTPESFEPIPIKQSVGPIFTNFKITFDYLILIKVNKSIQYFFTSDNITNQYKTLINCTHIKDKLDFESRNKPDCNSTAIWQRSAENSNRINNLEFILISIIIMIYIFLWSSVFICLCYEYVDCYRLVRRLWYKDYIQINPIYDCENPEEVVPLSEVIIEPIPEVLVEQLCEPFVPKILEDKEAEV